MDKLIFVEGLPGTGKTTITEWLKKVIEEKNLKVTCLLENNRQIPTNFFDIASIPEKEFSKLKRKYPSLTNIAIQVDGYFFIRYDYAPDDVRQVLLPFDIGDEYNHYFTVESYMAQTLLYIEYKFQKISEIEGIVIIDSGFMQNPINEILFRKGTVGNVKEYITKMSKMIQCYNCLCIYLDRGDINESMTYAKKIKGEFWYKHVMENMNLMGIPNHFHDRYLIETDIIQSNIFPSSICSVDGVDWSDAKKKIRNYLV